MGFYVLEAMFRFLDIRGRIPEFDDYNSPRSGPSLATSSGSTMARALLAVVAVAAFLTVTLWVAVWLALTLL